MATLEEARRDLAKGHHWAPPEPEPVDFIEIPSAWSLDPNDLITAAFEASSAAFDYEPRTLIVSKAVYDAVQALKCDPWGLHVDDLIPTKPPDPRRLKWTWPDGRRKMLDPALQPGADPALLHPALGKQKPKPWGRKKRPHGNAW